MWVQPSGSQVQLIGLVTIGGSYTATSETIDTLRFQKYGTDKAEYEPLIFKHDFSQSELKIYGSKNGISTKYEQTLSGIASTGDFKIKFSTLNTDKITIQYNDEKKNDATGTIFFKYNDNWNDWGPLSGTPYYNTNRIFSQLKRTRYSYIHICKSEQPTMCDTTLTPTAELNQELVLNCTAVGPATLSVAWTASSAKYSADITKNSEAINNAIKTKKDTTRDLDTVIESTLTIPKFTLGHVTTYTCKVSTSVGLHKEQVFTVSYSRDVKVTLANNENFYLAASKTAKFSFTVTGWPLLELNIITHYDKKEEEKKEDNDNSEKRDENDNSGSGEDRGEDLFTLKRIADYAAVPPSVTFEIQFIKQVPGDQFSFYFIDNTGGKNKTVRTYNVYRVGAKCKAGEYGVGTECKSCGTDQTSPAKSDSKSACVQLVSNCKAGFYGINNDCKKCPEGKTSKEKTVNVNSCFVDPNAQKSTGDDSENGSSIGGIVGSVVGGLAFIVILVVVLYVFVCRGRKSVAPAQRKTETELATRAEPRKEGGARVTVNPSAEVDVENAGDDDDEDPNDLYDNKNLQSFRKRKQKQQAEKKDSNFDQHLDDINIGIQALDDIKIEAEDPEPAYVELDKEHFRKKKEEKEAEKRRTLERDAGYPAQDKPAEPVEHTYAEAQDIISRRQVAVEEDRTAPSQDDHRDISQ